MLGAKPALYFRLDDASGPMAADSSGNGTHGFYSDQRRDPRRHRRPAREHRRPRRHSDQRPVPGRGRGLDADPRPGTPTARWRPGSSPPTASVAMSLGTGSTGTDQGFSLEECPNQVIVDAVQRRPVLPDPASAERRHLALHRRHLQRHRRRGPGDRLPRRRVAGDQELRRRFAGHPGAEHTVARRRCRRLLHRVQRLARRGGGVPVGADGATIAGQFTASGQGAPAAPTGVSATIGANSATVKWTAATAPTPVTAYVVSAFNGTHQESAIATSSTARSAILNGLRGGTPYTFHVVAYNGYGPGPAGVSAAATPTGAATTYSSAVIGDNPVAYYKLAELSGAPYAAESSGNGTLATYNASVTSFGNAPAVPNDGAKTVSSNSNDAIAFDGTLPGSNLPVANNPRTIVMWTKLGDGNCRYAMGYGNNSTNQGFGVVVCPNSVQVAGINDSAIFGTTHTLSDGNWHQIGGHIRRHQHHRLRRRRQPGHPAVQRDHQHPGRHHPVPGAGPGDAAGRWLGGLADVAIYPTALSASQIGGLFSASGYGVPDHADGVSPPAAGANQATVQWTDSSAPNTVRDRLRGHRAGRRHHSGQLGRHQRGPASATITGLEGRNRATRSRCRPSTRTGPAARPPRSSVTPTGSATTFASDVLADSPAAYYRLGEQTGLARRRQLRQRRPGQLQHQRGQPGPVAGVPDRPEHVDHHQRQQLRGLRARRHQQRPARPAASARSVAAVGQAGRRRLRPLSGRLGREHLRRRASASASARARSGWMSGTSRSTSRPAAST